MHTRQVKETLHAVRAERQRRGHDTRRLIIVDIPRPPGERPVNDPRSPWRVLLTQDMTDDERRQFGYAPRESPEKATESD
jgi:hypothetical protein